MADKLIAQLRTQLLVTDLLREKATCLVLVNNFPFREKVTCKMFVRFARDKFHIVSSGTLSGTYAWMVRVLPKITCFQHNFVKKIENLKKFPSFLQITFKVETSGISFQSKSFSYPFSHINN